jgi:serine/threonine-protein kinase
MPEPSLPPDLGTLAGGGSLSPEQLLEVLRADQCRRWRAGQRVLAEEYLRAFPALAGSPRDAQVLIWGEALLRWEVGERPHPDEYRARFPQHAEALAQQFELERYLGDQATRPGESPVIDTRAAPAPIKLEVLAGPHQGARFSFDRHQTFLVGRSADTSLQLIDDAHFSRHHFLLEVNPPRCYLRDLGSSNGTFVNGQRITECFLRDGDLISGGRTCLRISLPGLPPGRPAPPSSRPAPVLLAPGYKVERSLGQGAMGAVYLARRLATGQRCALKVILPESAADERAMQLFLREVSVLRRLDHPRIVRFLEIGAHQGQFFFAMEYVETIDLKAELARHAQEERVALICALICQALEGLQHAHDLGIVHRDVKPSNLLVARQDGRLAAFLADFGLAKNFENAGFSGMTHEGVVLGTVPFMAPEQVTQARLARPSVDIYAIGATLYNLLTDRVPHDFSRRKDPLAVILEEDPLPPRQHCPWLAEGLEAVILKALARDPGRRFGTAEEMRQALAGYAVV